MEQTPANVTEINSKNQMTTLLKHILKQLKLENKVCMTGRNYQQI